MPLDAYVPCARGGDAVSQPDHTGTTATETVAYARCRDADDAGQRIFSRDRHGGSSIKRVLILPTLCVGNVGQLAVDLLLCSLAERAEHVATLRHPLVLPCFGVNPYRKSNSNNSNNSGSGGGRSTNTNDGPSVDTTASRHGIEAHAAHPMDLYRVAPQPSTMDGDQTSNMTSSMTSNTQVETEVYLLQQRAPASAGCQVAFSRDLMEWVRDSKSIDELWIVGSVDAEYRRDIDLGPPSGSLTHNMKYVAADDGDLGDVVAAMVRACDSVGLEAMVGGEGDASASYRELVEDESSRAHMPWAMISAARAYGVASVGVVKFVLEGDNRPDAVAVARVVARLVGLNDLDVGADVPSSWLVL